MVCCFLHTNTSRTKPNLDTCSAQNVTPTGFVSKFLFSLIAPTSTRAFPKFKYFRLPVQHTSFTCFSLIIHFPSFPVFHTVPQPRSSSLSASAVWQTLCWMQPEPSSPFLLPGSPPLFLSLYLSEGNNLSPALPFPLRVSPFPLHPNLSEMPNTNKMCLNPRRNSKCFKSILVGTQRHRTRSLFFVIIMCTAAAARIHALIQTHTWKHLFSRSFSISIKTPPPTHPAASCVFGTGPSLLSWWGSPTHRYSHTSMAFSWEWTQQYSQLVSL